MDYKFDTDKPRMSLVPFKQIEKIAKVLTFGASKYKDNSWQTLDNAEDRYFSATMRHLAAYQQGEELDEESGMSHLAHAATNLIFLLYFEDKITKAQKLIKFKSLDDMDKAGLKFVSFVDLSGDPTDLIEAGTHSQYVWAKEQEIFHNKPRCWFTVYTDNRMSSGIHWANALYYMRLQEPLPDKYYYGDDHFFKYCEELDD